MTEPGSRSPLARTLRIALLLLAGLVVAVILAAWLAGGPENLPVDYEGFD